MTKTKLAQALASGRLAITAECLPPRSGDAAAVKKLSAALPPGLDAVVVADNPDEIHGSALACAAILAAEGHATVLSMVTRDRNRIALESDALGAMALGVDAILCLSGDHQSLGACPQAAGVYDIDSVQFAQALNRMRREGSIESAAGWLVGAAAHPVSGTHRVEPAPPQEEDCGRGGFRSDAGGDRPGRLHAVDGCRSGSRTGPAGGDYRRRAGSRRWGDGSPAQVRPRRAWHSYLQRRVRIAGCRRDPASGIGLGETEMPDRYHIHTVPAPARFRRVGKFGNVDWREDCSRCTNCVKLRCCYDVYKHESAYNRDPLAPVADAGWVQGVSRPACRAAPRDC